MKSCPICGVISVNMDLHDVACSRPTLPTAQNDVAALFSKEHAAELDAVEESMRHAEKLQPLAWLVERGEGMDGYGKDQYVTLTDATAPAFWVDGKIHDGYTVTPLYAAPVSARPAIPEDALRYAREFVADPDKRAQVKVQLCVNGWPQLADMIDEAVAVSRALLALDGGAKKEGQDG